MTKRELEKLLKSNGWKISHAATHDQATNPDNPGIKIPLPRHKGDIPKGTVNSILKDAGLK